MDWGEHQGLIKARLDRGEIVLAVGAGVNGDSKNRGNKPIVTGWGLCERLADEIGEAYNGEPLADVASAVEHVLGRDAVNRVLIREFRYTKPSDDLRKLFRYSWKRFYNWNYDDSILDAASSSVQRTSIYNGMSDFVEDVPGPSNIQVVFLHGMITQLEKGIVLTNEDYADVLQRGDHAWYRKITQDYRSSTVVFIGSSLNEPILSAELERAARTGIGAGGLAFLITPDAISGLRSAALAKRGIIHVQGTLEDFVGWLQINVGPSKPPSALIQPDRFFNESNLDRFTFDDVAAAQSIRPIDRASLINAFEAESSHRQASAARSFLNGFPASWQLASSNVPVKLHQLPELKRHLIEAAKERKELFVTVGQAGSGKTTATMQALIDISSEGLFDVFELSSETKSVSKALDVLSRISDRPKLVYLPNLFSFGTALEDDFDQARHSQVTFVSTARSSEWKEHFERHFSRKSCRFSFQRFSTEDYDPLIDRLKAYVPAPRFMQMKHDQQVERLAKSKSQLLIALREATESRNFDEVILSEFNSLADDDVKDLFLIVGVATLARVGIEPAVAAEAYNSVKRERSFNEALERLDGIVAPLASGRLIGRHEFYVRNILDQAVNLDVTLRIICDSLRTFTKYTIPITRHVGRSDAALFRFLLNHGFLRERSERGGDKYAGLEVYRNFEIDFQLDGHFWLQYGLYYQRLGNSQSAIAMLEKSIEAFPGNPFAIHALASERLMQARKRQNYDQLSKRLIDLAVLELERLDANPVLAFDQYPLVTLARHHIPTLLHHDQRNLAMECARNYYERLRIMEKTVSSTEITDEKARLLKFVTSGIWEQ
jgi:tetratricopeptide (TPR) repeat protein